MIKVGFQRPITGSQWFYGNFTFGVSIDSHPRFFNIGLCFGIVEFYISWTKKE